MAGVSLLTLLTFAALCLVQSGASGPLREHRRVTEQGKINKQNGIQYLEAKSKEAGVIALESGILVEILQESSKSDAKSPEEGDKCEVTYSAALIDGTSIFETGSAVFAPVKPIEGWTEVMQLMVEGDKWRVYIPYELAYGPRGHAHMIDRKHQPKIPSYSPMVFDIEIVEVKWGLGKSMAAARAAFEKAKKHNNATVNMEGGAVTNS